MNRNLRIDIEIGGRILSLETGELAKQADGSVVARYGDTVVLATAVQAKKAKENVDFVPLTVDYREGTYASGRFPGGFFKREGRPTEKETLTSRLIDRPFRPLFPDFYATETQLIATVLSNDIANDPDMVAMCGIGAALYWSPIPIAVPVAGVRIGQVNGRLIVNPTREEMEAGTLNLIVAGTDDAILMVESGAQEVSEELMIEGLMMAHEEIKKVCAAVRAAVPASEIIKRPVAQPVEDEALRAHITEYYQAKLLAAMTTKGKLEMYGAMDAVKDELVKSLGADATDARKSMAKRYFEDLTIKHFREYLLGRRTRLDGRALDQIRAISIKVGLLPRTHGSAVFTRGETQALGMVTLGTSHDQQLIDWYAPDAKKRFMLHYNFPPYSVNEVKFLRGAGRREIGHGALAERAIQPLLPKPEDFPYTIRVVSEILESNGSSSQATICAASLALMDAGVPLKAACAGVAMGLVKEESRYAILSDIAGLEDHFGDMDFKVAGTRAGITALQMDIKVTGLTVAIMKEALMQARAGRMHILDQMELTLAQSRGDLHPFAPRILTIPVPKEKIGMIIGPGGKNIRAIEESTGATVEIDDATSTVQVACVDLASAEKAMAIIKGMIAEAEVGKTYMGKVMRIEAYGAFIEIMPGKEGLLHISEMSENRVEKVEDEMKLGDEILVKVVPSDMPGKIRLSRKAIFNGDEGGGGGGARGGRGGGDRGGSGGGGGRDRGGRGGSGGGGDRGGRGRDERPRFDRPDRDRAPEPAPAREPRSFDDRPARAEYAEPAERPERPARPDYQDRPEREERPPARDWAAREERPAREPAPARDSWRGRDEAPAPRETPREAPRDVARGSERNHDGEARDPRPRDSWRGGRSDAPPSTRDSGREEFRPSQDRGYREERPAPRDDRPPSRDGGGGGGRRRY